MALDRGAPARATRRDKATSTTAVRSRLGSGQTNFCWEFLGTREIKIHTFCWVNGQFPNFVRYYCVQTFVTSLISPQRRGKSGGVATGFVHVELCPDFEPGFAKSFIHSLSQYPAKTRRARRRLRPTFDHFRPPRPAHSQYLHRFPPTRTPNEVRSPAPDIRVTAGTGSLQDIAERSRNHRDRTTCSCAGLALPTSGVILESRISNMWLPWVWVSSLHEASITKVL